MGEEFVKKVDQIIELLESGENSLYTYDEDKKIFKMLDKKRNINLTAKLEQDNFYFKDSISGKVYIFVKSHLNKNTTIQQILMNYGSDRYYCMYAEKNNELELMRVVEKTQNDIMICTNKDLDNKTKDEIIKYMNETDEYEEDNDNPELQDEEEHNKLSDEEILEEFFSSYKVRYNNEEIEGEEKREIVLESEEILDEYYYDSLTMNNVAKVLTETLKNMQRKHEHESR